MRPLIRASRALPTAIVTFLLMLLAAALPAVAPAQEVDPALEPGAFGAERAAAVAAGPGLTYERIAKKTNKTVHVLTYDPAAESSIEVATARLRIPGFARTSVMAKREGAVAAINGDFGLQPGRPAHAIAIDGELLQTTVQGKYGQLFAVSFDETQAYAGSARVEVSIVPHGPDPGPAWRVHSWNAGPPTGDQVAGFSAFGGSLEVPPANVCAARLIPIGDRQWSPDGNAIDRPHEVVLRRCGGKSMLLNDGVVITGRLGRDGGDRIEDLEVGDEVDLRWGSNHTGIVDLIGGSPTLLRDGEVVVGSGRDCSNGYLCASLHPRTAVGFTADGRTLMVVVDGRRSNATGMTLEQLAIQMKRLGAVNAINLDGGGSSTMWIKGRGIVSRPSDGHERAVSSALLVLPGADPNQPVIAPAP